MLALGDKTIALQREIAGLREKLLFSESQLNESKEYTSLLTKKLKDAEEEIERCHSKIAK